MDEAQGVSHEPSRRRMLIGYALLLGIVALVMFVAISAGSAQTPTRDIDGRYELSGAELACLGTETGVLIVEQSGQFATLAADGSAATGRLAYREGRLSGDVTCTDGSLAALDATIDGAGGQLAGTLGGASLSATHIEAAEGAEGEGAQEAGGRPAQELSPEELFGRLMLAIALVMITARLGGSVVSRLGQPRVMGEVLAGILLGPTLLGAIAPGVQAYLFPPQVIPLLAAGAAIGLVFYMFIVGLELDPAMLEGRVEQAAFISHASIAIPMMLGVAVAVPLYPVLAPQVPFLPFALFMGVSMSVTAFPVLARILVERRMLRRPVGAMAIAAAAVDDVTAWGLLALSAAAAALLAPQEPNQAAPNPLLVIALAVGFVAFMVFIARPLLARVSKAYDEAGNVPPAWIATIFIGILLSAFVASWVGIAYVFGAFVMGMIMPRRADLSHDVTRRMEDFVTAVLLPLFFVVTGLSVEIGLLDRPELWLLTIVLIAVAVIAKWAGAMLAARFTGLKWRESAAIGALMNTRGLAELIVLNIGLHLGVISPALFTALVIMALVTTFMTGPALRLIDPHNRFGAPPEEELRAAQAAPAPAHGPARAARPERLILVAAQDEKNLPGLVAVAEPLASSMPPRELILARLIAPSRSATGLSADEQRLGLADAELRRHRDLLADRGVAVRSVAFTSAQFGDDLLRLATEQDVDLLLLDGRRPLFGEGIPTGPVGMLLARAPCDVAVLIEREELPRLGPDQPVMVPFGGAEHDWAALELGAWIASGRQAPLQLLGAAADQQSGSRDASRTLASASLVLQGILGITAEPVLVEGQEGLLGAAERAGLLVVGLSERWREEGLGEVRSAIARSAQAPILLVRRGTRPGALAPRTDVTRFTWSGADGGGGFSPAPAGASLSQPAPGTG